MYPVLVPFLFNPVGMNKSFGFFSSSTVFYEWDIIFRRRKKKKWKLYKTHIHSAARKHVQLILYIRNEEDIVQINPI